MNVSDATRNETWQMMLDLERQVRYYSKIADRYSLRYRAIRYMLLFGIVVEGAIVYFLQGETLLLWTLRRPRSIHSRIPDSFRCRHQLRRNLRYFADRCHALRRFESRGRTTLARR